jgi:hypothetical protein
MKHPIKRLLAALTLAMLMGLLSGCYVAPGYSYVQSNGAAGDVYYGSGPAVVYNGYYPYYGYGYYPYGGYWGGYYGGYYGCCWGGYYGGRYWRGGGGWHGRGGWSGGRGGGWHGGGGHGGGGGHWGGH